MYNMNNKILIFFLLLLDEDDADVKSEIIENKINSLLEEVSELTRGVALKIMVISSNKNVQVQLTTKRPNDPDVKMEPGKQVKVEVCVKEVLDSFVEELSLLCFDETLQIQGKSQNKKVKLKISTKSNLDVNPNSGVDSLMNSTDIFETTVCYDDEIQDAQSPEPSGFLADLVDATISRADAEEFSLESTNPAGNDLNSTVFCLDDNDVEETKHPNVEMRTPLRKKNLKSRIDQLMHKRILSRSMSKARVQ